MKAINIKIYEQKKKNSFPFIARFNIIGKEDLFSVGLWNNSDEEAETQAQEFINIIKNNEAQEEQTEIIKSLKKKYLKEFKNLDNEKLKTIEKEYRSSMFDDNYNNLDQCIFTGMYQAAKHLQTLKQ